MIEMILPIFHLTMLMLIDIIRATRNPNKKKG